MNLVDVREEIARALTAIPNLRIYPYEVETLTPPAAVIGYPTINYDQAFQRGLDRWEGLITIVVSSVFDRTAANALSPLVDGHSSESVHAVLRAHTWTTCAYVRATRALFPPGGVLVANVPYLGYEIDLDIAGQGTT